MAVTRMTGESTYVFLNLRDYTLDDPGNLRPVNHVLLTSSPLYSLGALARLPLEALEMVIVQLDIQTLVAFQRVSRRARQTVDRIPQYRRIMQHAPDAIHGSLSIGSGRWFSCQELYETLCMANCESCGDFGGYIYLITCRRVCFLCFTEKIEYLPLIQADAARKFGLARKDMETIPNMRSVPGLYSSRCLLRKTRLTLIDYTAARQAGLTLHGSLSAMEQYSSKMMSQKLRRYDKSRTSLNRTSTGRSKPRPPKLIDKFDGQTSNPKRFMGVVRAPHINPRTQALDWGVHCIACRSPHYTRPCHWRRRYTAEGFQDHIQECGEIMNQRHTKHLKPAMT